MQVHRPTNLQIFNEEEQAGDTTITISCEQCFLEQVIGITREYVSAVLSLLHIPSVEALCNGPVLRLDVFRNALIQMGVHSVTANLLIDCLRNAPPPPPS